jgi:hypothetical protein
MLELWERIEKGFEVSNRGRVRGRLGRIIPPDKRSIARGTPCVLVGGSLRKIRTLVAEAFGDEAGEVAELVVLGEDAILERKGELEDKVRLADEALVMARSTPEVPPKSREIRAGEDLLKLFAPRPVTPAALALEDARHLAAVYRSGLPADPLSDMTRDEVGLRLLKLKNLFGAPIDAEIKDLVLPGRAATVALSPS